MPSNISRLVLVVGTAIIITVAAFFYLADQGDERPITASPESLVLNLEDLSEGWVLNGTEWFVCDNITFPVYAEKGWTWGVERTFSNSSEGEMWYLHVSVTSWNSSALANDFYGSERDAWEKMNGNCTSLSLDLGDEGMMITDYELEPGLTVYTFREGNIRVLIIMEPFEYGDRPIEPWMEEIVNVQAERIHEYNGT